MGRRVAIGALICAALAGGACSEPPARLVVTVCGDLRVPDDVDAVRVTVLDEDRTPAYDGVVELAPPGPAPDALPGSAAPALDAAVPDAAAPDADTTDAGATDAGPADAGAPDAAAGEAVAVELRLPTGRGRMWVSAQALRGGIEVARAEVRARARGGDAHALLALTRLCRGVACPIGQSCLAGACALTPDETPRAACAPTLPDAGAP